MLQRQNTSDLCFLLQKLCSLLYKLQELQEQAERKGLLCAAPHRKSWNADGVPALLFGGEIASRGDRFCLGLAKRQLYPLDPCKRSNYLRGTGSTLNLRQQEPSASASAM